MNRWNIDEGMYLEQVDNIMPASNKGFVHRHIGVMDVCTGEKTFYDFLILEKWYIVLKGAGYWYTFCKKLCNDRERVFADANYPNDDLTLPILQIVMEVKIECI